MNNINSRLPLNFILSDEIGRAIKTRLPAVALASTVITHGLPRPQNLELARAMEQTVRENGATPATIAVIDGQSKAYEILVREKARAETERDLIDAIAEGLSHTTPDKYFEEFVISINGILDQSLKDVELRPYIANETLESLKKLRELLNFELRQKVLFASSLVHRSCL